MKLYLEEKEAICQKIPLGAIFRHYKGREYKVLQIARESSTLDFLVVYQGLYHCPEFGPFPVWIRPLKEFLETVSVEGKQVPRFSLTHEPNAIYD